MSVRVKIPLDYSGVTLEQFCNYYLCKTDVERVMHISGKNRKFVEALPIRTLDKLIVEYEAAIMRGAPKHEQTFVIDGMRLGFFPDINDLTTAEHIDMEAFAQSIWKEDGNDYTNLIKLCCVMFRPVNGLLGKYYEIDEYDSAQTKRYVQYVKQIPMDRVNGALVFFSTIEKELFNASMDYTQQMIQMAKKELETLALDYPSTDGFT